MACQSLRSHILDSRFYSSGYTTDEARRIFCDLRRLQRWLEVETALAKVQADLGIIPAAAAQYLQKTANLKLLDVTKIQEDIVATGHSLIPLLSAWQSISGDSGQYIHYGATTQDIQDTAQVLEIRDVFVIIERDLTALTGSLIALADTYKGLVMIGRTHGQPALPTTLGLKIGVWLDELLRSAARLMDCKKRILVSQLFGGVGTMAAFGEKGIVLLEKFSALLDLGSPLAAWHSSRDRFAEYLSAIAILGGCLGKIGNEISQLSRAEIRELEEPFHFGKIGSTTMPHKRNPELCEQVVVLAKLIKSNADLGFEALINEHERDYRSIRLEWVSITEASLFLCGALALMKKIINDLIVHKDRIEQNTKESSFLISTEKLMFLLGEKIGKQKAHQILYEAAMESHDSGTPIIDLLVEHLEIKSLFKRQNLEAAMDPSGHIGLAKDLTQNVIESAKRWLSDQDISQQNLASCPLANKDGQCFLENGTV